MDETAGSTAAPAARCRKILRGSFIGVLLPDRLYCTRVNGRGRAMRAWIDRTNDGLSGMPADGISLPLKRGLRHFSAGPFSIRAFLRNELHRCRVIVRLLSGYWGQRARVGIGWPPPGPLGLTL